MFLFTLFTGLWLIFCLNVAKKLQRLVKHWFITYTPSGIGHPLILLDVLPHDNYYCTITIFLLWSNNIPTYSFCPSSLQHTSRTNANMVALTLLRVPFQINVKI